MKPAFDYGEQLLSIAEQSGGEDLLLQAYRPHGLCLFYMGRFEEARTHLETAAEIYDVTRHAEQRFLYGSDPGVLARCNLAWVEWFLGLPERAVKLAAESIAAAKELDHPHSLAFALSLTGSIHHLRRDMDALRHSTAEALALSEEHKFPYWLSWNEVLRGWLIAQDGDVAAGLTAIEKGLSAYRETGAELMVPYFSTLLADTLVGSGRYGEALNAAQGALDLADSYEIRFYQVDLLRIVALARLKLGHADEARADYHIAYGLACEQRSPTMRLRVLIDRLTHLGSAERLALEEELRRAYQELTEGHEEHDARIARQMLRLGHGIGENGKMP